MSILKNGPRSRYLPVLHRIRTWIKINPACFPQNRSASPGGLLPVPIEKPCKLDTYGTCHATVNEETSSLSDGYFNRRLQLNGIVRLYAAKALVYMGEDRVSGNLNDNLGYARISVPVAGANSDQMFSGRKI